MGNLFASTIVRVRPTDPAPASLAFVAAVAVHDTVRQIAPEVVISLKWPNDVLAQDGAKLCGMLLERAGDAVIVGIGLNLVTHPRALDRKVSDLRTLGATPPDAQSCVEILADAFARWLLVWRQAGLPSIISQWEAHAHARGTALSAKLPDGGELNGLYAGLEDDGALRLSLADGSFRAIHAADIFLI